MLNSVASTLVGVALANALFAHARRLADLQLPHHRERLADEAAHILQLGRQLVHLLLRAIRLGKERDAKTGGYVGISFETVPVRTRRDGE